MGKVDVILNVSGKPYQTILTIYSLIKFSKNSINKIFIIFEKKTGVQWRHDAIIGLFKNNYYRGWNLLY